MKDRLRSNSRLPVYIDGLIYQLQETGGISRYLNELVRCFAQSDLIEPTLLVPPRPLGDFPQCVAVRSRSPNRRIANWAKCSDRFGRMVDRWQDGRIAQVIDDRKNAIYFSPYYETLPLKNTPSVVTVYDLIYERFPTIFSTPADETFRRQRLKCIQQADRIVAISENTRRDIVEFCGVDPEKIDVTHLAADRDFWSSHSDGDHEEWKRRNGLTSRFLAFVGSRGGYKNFELVLRTLPRLDADLHLVAAGSAWNAEEAAVISDLGIQQRVHLLLRPSSQDLAMMMASSAMLVYPSLYEGFGLPPLEAMACGTPVVAAQAGSIPEVCGNAARFFDPTSVDDLAIAIDQVSEQAFANQLIEEGHRRVSQFDWNTTAEKTVQVFRRVLGNRS